MGYRSVSAPKFLLYLHIFFFLANSLHDRAEELYEHEEHVVSEDDQHENLKYAEENKGYHWRELLRHGPES